MDFYNKKSLYKWCNECVRKLCEDLEVTKETLNCGHAIEHFFCRCI